jgi:thiol-disulfide isomerase/thioredoxin
MPVDKPSWKTPLFAMKLAAIVLIGIILIAIYIKTNNLNPNIESINLSATNHRLKSENKKPKQIKNYRVIEPANVYIDPNDLTEILNHSNLKASLIFFWATWCPNCKEQLLNLAKVQNKFPKKLKVIAINIDEKKSSKEVSAY